MTVERKDVLKGKGELLDCGQLERGKFGWAYEMLCHARAIEAILLINDTPEEMINSRLIGSAIMLSCVLNLLEQLHGTEECIVKGRECIIQWARDYLDMQDIPNLSKERNVIN